MVEAGRKIGRRVLLQGLALAGAAGLTRGATAAGIVPPQRLAAIDWAMLETACAIGQAPVAACELIRFRAENDAVRLPSETVDLGLRGSPNFEQLRLVAPDLILSSPFYTRQDARFQAVAPVFSLPFYVPGEPSLPHALEALEALGARLGAGAAGNAARRAAELHFDQLKDAVRGHAERPVMLLDFGDAVHFRAFGADSLYGSTLERIGVANAWREKTRFSFTAPIAIDRLVDMPDAVFVLVSAVPVEAREQLSRSVLWNALAPVKAGRVYQLPATNAFGGVPSALAFASHLVGVLSA